MYYSNLLIWILKKNDMIVYVVVGKSTSATILTIATITDYPSKSINDSSMNDRNIASD